MEADNAERISDVFPVYAGRYRRALVLLPFLIIVFGISTLSSSSYTVSTHNLPADFKTEKNTYALQGNFTKTIYNRTVNARTRRKICTDDKSLMNAPVKALKANTDDYNSIKEQLRLFFLNSDTDLTNRYMVYDCSGVRRGRCGGWADRLSGIVTTFIISLITKRHFMINHDLPCRLDQYLVPNEYDWRMNESRLAHKKAVYYFFNCDEPIRKTFRYGDLDKHFSSDVSYIRVNWDYIVDFRLRKGIENRLAWLLKFNVADIEKAIFEFLFKQSPQIMNSIQELKGKNTNDKIVCAHIRIGKNPLLPNDRPRTNENALTEIWKVLKVYDQKDYTIYIMSDSHSVKLTARSRLRHFVYDTHVVYHIDDIRCDCDGFKQMLLDFYLLQDRMCDVMVVGQSGFSIKAAFMRNTSTGMYCMRRNSVIPCSRYTLYDVYPNWFRPYINVNLPEYQLLI